MNEHQIAVLRKWLVDEIERAVANANHYAVNITPKAAEVCEYWRGRVSALADVLAKLDVELAKR